MWLNDKVSLLDRVSQLGLIVDRISILDLRFASRLKIAVEKTNFLIFSFKGEFFFCMRARARTHTESEL